MAIQKIDNVTINGKNFAFGGYIYSVDLDVALADAPSKITINFVSESGEYQKPVLSAVQPYRIEIGNIVDNNYYAITSETHRSSSGRTLQVIFYDGSVILDRIWVGLHRKMGDKTTNKIANLIIVGTERHPCDVNQDGVFDQKDIDELYYDDVDACELICPADMPTELMIINECNKKALLQLFDVTYNFQDLLTAIAQKGIKVEVEPSNVNSFYFAKHVGTLRQVLKNWCSEFGWTFYWENDTLNFLDVSKPPVIDFTVVGCLESKNEKQTLEGTIARGAISHYGEPGVLSESDCSEAADYNTTCITLQDMYGAFYNPSAQPLSITQGVATISIGPKSPPPQPDSADNNSTTQEYADDIFPNGIPIPQFEASCVCSYYHDKLRQLYNFFQYYGIATSTIANNLIGKKMDRLGAMKIYKVFSTSSVDAAGNANLTTADINKSGYSLLLNGKIGKGNKNIFGTIGSPEYVDNVNTFKSLGGYFVVAEFDGDHLSKQFQIEHNLATQFYGQHWYRSYTSPYAGESPQVTPGGAQYFGALATDTRDIPFAKFNPTYQSKIAKMLQAYVYVQKNDFQQYGSLVINDPYVALEGTTKIVRSFLYFHKNPVWSPTNQQQNYFQNLIDTKGELLPKPFVVDSSDLRSIMTTQDATDAQLENLQLFAFFPGSFKLTVDLETNPQEEYPFVRQVSDGAESSQFGLLSRSCASYTIDGVKIFTPAGASIQFANSSDFQWLERDTAYDPSTPQYRLCVVASRKNRGYIQKTESVYTTAAAPTDTTLTVDYTVKEINKGSARYLAALTPSCQFDPKLLEAAHILFNTDLDFSVTKPFQSIQYVLTGVTLPNPISIKDGLQSMSVKIDDKGVFSTITIGNEKFVVPSADFLTRRVEFGLDAALFNGRPNPI